MVADTGDANSGEDRRIDKHLDAGVQIACTSFQATIDACCARDRNEPRTVNGRYFNSGTRRGVDSDDSGECSSSNYGRQSGTGSRIAPGRRIAGRGNALKRLSS